MKLYFIKPQEIERNIKATVHKSGKIGFTIEASNKLHLNESKSIAIATNVDDDTDENLYIKVLDRIDNEAFKLGKAGDYFYINTKLLLDKLNIDYNNSEKTIMYDIFEDVYDNEEIYILKKREVLKKQK